MTSIELVRGRGGAAGVPPGIDTAATTESQTPVAYGDQMARYLGLGKAPSIVIGCPNLRIAITRLTSTGASKNRAAHIPRERAFVVALHLAPTDGRGCEIWLGERHSRVAAWPAGGIGIFDLEASPRIQNHGPVDWVHYHVPRSTLDAFADDSELPNVESLRCSFGSLDPVLYSMTEMILPSLDGRGSFSELFFDYYCLLFCAHVTKAYGSSPISTNAYRGGLAPWQKRRVTELLAEHLDGSVRLATLAEECGLSISHFARSFRRTFGSSAHQYLIRRRIERAKALLSTSECALSETALQAGFSDQAAFSRTFKAVVGTSPGQWRREICHRDCRLSYALSEESVGS